MHGVDDRVDADGPRDLQRGQVERFAQRLTHRDRAVLLLRRVLRGVRVTAAVRHRPLDVVQPTRRGHARLEHAGEVGEQLEGRPRLPVRDAGVVVVALHLRCTAVVVVAPDVREDLTGRRIHGDQGRVVHIEALEGVDVIADLLLGKLLHVPIERREHRVAAAVRGLLAQLADELLAHAEREVRRVERGGGGLYDDGLGLGRIGFADADVAAVDHGVEHLCTPRLCRVRVLHRVVVRRALREAGEHRHLAERQPHEVGLVEVGLRRGLDAVGLIAVVDLVQVHLEDLLLAEGARRLHGEDRFLDLPRERWLVTQEARLDELLRDRRATLRDRPARGVRVHRSDDATDVDARIGPERFVLDGDRRVLHLLGDGIEADELAALVLERVEEVLSRAVVDLGRQRDRDGREVVSRRKVRGEIAEHRRHRDTAHREHRQEERADTAGQRAEALSGCGAAGKTPALPLWEAIRAIRAPQIGLALDCHAQAVTNARPMPLAGRSLTA